MKNRTQNSLLALLVMLFPLWGMAAEHSVSIAAEEVVERVPLHTVVPVYPEKARRARVEGEVEVCFRIDREGRTRGVAVRRSSNRVFERPARNAVKASTFQRLEPGQKVPEIKNCRTFRFLLERVAVE